jgi:hypothetical protein
MNPLKSTHFYELLFSIAVVLPLVLFLAKWVKGQIGKNGD